MTAVEGLGSSVLARVFRDLARLPVLHLDSRGLSSLHTNIQCNIHMKRKRQNREAQRAKKRVKIDGGGLQRPTHALLQQYYSHVVTLRQYLAARTPKQRRRRLQQYGRDAHSRDDPAVSQILDHVLVGAFKHVEVEESSFIVDEDITLFTQQISEADPTLPLTPGKLKQSEVGISRVLRVPYSLNS